MTKRIVPFAALTLLVLAVGYRMLVGENSQRATPPDSAFADLKSAPLDEEQSMNGAVGYSEVDQSAEIVGPEGLHQDLLALPERNRNHVFWLTIRDAGFQCDDVVTSQLVIAETGAWHAHCGGLSTYSIVIDEFSKISVNPISYEDIVE